MRLKNLSLSSTILSIPVLQLFLYGQVDKVFGPGNQYVTAAKMMLQVCPMYSLGTLQTCSISRTSLFSSVLANLDSKF